MSDEPTVRISKRKLEKLREGLQEMLEVLLTLRHIGLGVNHRHIGNI